MVYSLLARAYRLYVWVARYLVCTVCKCCSYSSILYAISIDNQYDARKIKIYLRVKLNTEYIII